LRVTGDLDIRKNFLLEVKEQDVMQEQEKVKQSQSQGKKLTPT